MSSECLRVVFMQKYHRNSVYEVKNVLDMLNIKMWVDLINQWISLLVWWVFYFVTLCLLSRYSKSHSCRLLDTYSTLLSDVVPAVPPELLGSLLYEELTEQRDRMLFSEGATGGALAFVPFSQSGSDSQSGCLIYPGKQGHDCLSILQTRSYTRVLRQRFTTQ